MNQYYKAVVFVVLLSLVSTSNVLAGSFSSAAKDPAASAAADKFLALANQVSSLPTNQIIVQYKTSSSARLQPARAGLMERLSQVAGASLQYQRAMSGDAHVLRLPGKLPLDQVQVIVARLRTSPDIQYAEPDQIRYPILGPMDVAQAPAFLSPNDTQYANQWHYYETWGMNAPAAWDITTGSASIVVAVIDTGITNHSEFVGRTVPGYDFINEVQTANDGNLRDNDPSDPGDWITSAENGSGFFAGCQIHDSSWHGTHVAGTIGAASNNGVGVAGINWNSKILPVRVLGKCGGYDSDIADGMRWSAGLAVSGVPANANPAKVLNLSLGGQSACGTTYQNAINAITAAGAVVVVAAGNNNVDASGFTPANCTGVITVASTGRTGNRAYYSNYGTSVEISAPGGDQSGGNANGVLSTLNTGTQGPVADTYVYYQGTSMAAPHLSGVVSLLLSLNPALTPAQVLQILQSTVKVFPIGGTCTTSNCGSGIVNAGAALSSLSPTATPTRTRTPTAILTPTRTNTPCVGCSPTPTLTRTRTPTVGPVYLPLIRKDATYTPTPTPTQTQLPSAGIINGNFESGSVGWTQYSSHGWTIITTSFPGSVTARSGSRATWLGGDYNDLSYIQQQVVISAGAPYLVYWHWIASSDSCGWDFGGVLINGSVVDVYNLCSSTGTSGWVRHSVYLGAYAGQSVMLQIRAETDGTLNSNLFVDDVVLQANPSVPGPADGIVPNLDASTTEGKFGVLPPGEMPQAVDEERLLSTTMLPK